MWWIPVFYTKEYHKTEVGANVREGWQEVRIYDVLETVSENRQVLRGLFAPFLSSKEQRGLIQTISYFWKDNCEFCMVGIFLSLKFLFMKLSLSGTAFVHPVPRQKQFWNELKTFYSASSFNPKITRDCFLLSDSKGWMIPVEYLMDFRKVR